MGAANQIGETMFTQHEKRIKHACYILLILMMLFGIVGSMTRPAQAAAPVLAQFTSSGHALGFTANGIYAAAGTHALRVDFVNANNVQPRADSPADPSTSLREAPPWGRTGTDGKAASLNRVTYPDLWPGIRLAYDAPAGTILRSTYILQPGANPKDIRLRYNTPLTLNEDGTLRLAFETGVLAESAPIAWQEIGGKRVSVDARFFLPPARSALSGMRHTETEAGGQTVTFVLGAYDPRYPLTIDPDLTWSAFLGGEMNDSSHSIAIDGNGDIYVTGDSAAAWSCSPTDDCTVIPYTGASDAFVAKLNGASGELAWNTFLGGNGTDNSMGVAADGSGNIYVAGYSDVSWGAPLRDKSGDFDGFVARLDAASGALTWNTFLGGTAADRGWGIAVDGNGNVYVTGNSATAWSCSPTDCTVRAFGGIEDAYIARLDGTSGTLTWNTFLGGSGTTVGYGLATDGSNIYVTGYSTETWGIPLRDYTGNWDGFAAKLNSVSGYLTWNTFLGGSADDLGYGIVVDGNGYVYVTGRSNTAWGSPLRDYGGGNADGFVAKLDPSGALTWNTFLGGTGYDFGYGITVDGSGNAYVAGNSDTAWGNPLRGYTNNYDGFAAKLDPAGALAWNTFLGGSGNDRSYGIAVFGGNENYYVSGYSDAAWGNPLRAYTGDRDTFVTGALCFYRIHLPLVMR